MSNATRGRVWVVWLGATAFGVGMVGKAWDRQPKWQVFSPEGGAYSVEVPNVPRAEEIPGGGVLWRAHLRDPGGSYTIQEEDLTGASAEELRALFDVVRENLETELGHAIVEERDASFEEFPGREFMVALVVQGHELEVRRRVVRVDLTLYYLTAATFPQSRLVGDRFLRSFCPASAKCVRNADPRGAKASSQEGQ